MAAFVKSVERIRVDFPSGTGLVTATAALTKGQNPAKCAAFGNSRFDSGTSNAVADYSFAYRVFDNAGTPTLEVSSNQQTSPGSTVEATVIEWGNNVTVQQGGPVVLDDFSVTENISAVNQDNAFVIFSHRTTSAGTIASFSRFFVRARFLSNTQIEFIRRSSSLPDPEIFYTVVESNGTDFQTEYVVESISSFDEGPDTVTLTNTVNLNHSFLIPSFNTDAGTFLKDVGFSSEITGPNEITWTREHNGTVSSAASDYSWWVVRSDSAGIESTQQVVVDTNSTSNGITDKTITSVDLDRSAIITGKHLPQGDWPAVNVTSSSSSRQYKSTLEFLAADEVRVRNNRLATSSLGRDFYFSVVEFILEAAGPGPQTIPVGLVEETDSVLAVTPVGGPATVSVGLVEETDSVLAVTPVTGGEPQTIPVGIVSEIDSVLAVTPVAGEVSVPVGVVSETDTVLPVTPVEGPVSVSVGIVEETNLIAPVFPVVEGGPQTVLVINVAERDFVLPVTPRLPSDEVPGGIPTKPRKPSRKKRRYILPDNRVFTDPERALYELRELLKAERATTLEASGGGTAVSSTSDASLGQETPPSDTIAPDEPVSPQMLESALTELPELLLARPETVPSLDPQLISVLFQMIDDEEAAMLLL